MSAESFLTPEEVAELLRISVETVRRWIREGRLPAYKPGRFIRIKRTDLDQWLSERHASTMVNHIPQE